MPGDPPLKSEFPVHDVVCEDAFFGYWAGLNVVWDSDRTIVNLEHDMEFSDDLVRELLSCPHDLCAFPYKVRPFGWPGMRHGASYGCLWVATNQPYASFSSIGFCKMTAKARAGSTLERAIWDKVEGVIHTAIVRDRQIWHLHWPAIEHYHDYSAGIDPEFGTLYNLVRRARDEGRLFVYGDPLTDEDLENLKSHDPLIYDESLRERIASLCPD